MSIIDIIENIPASTDLELETYKDNRMRLHLLYKEGSDRMDVLLTPFGENIKGKKDITTYIRLLPDGDVISSTWNDAKLEDVFLKDNSRYFIMRTEDIRAAVLPFKIFKDIVPYKIMPNAFTELVAECNENLIKKIFEAGELAYDMMHDKTKCSPLILFDKIEDLSIEVSSVYSPLRSYVVDAFKNESSPSKKLSRLDRKIMHFFVRDIERFCARPDTKEHLLFTGLKKNYFYNPLKHFVFSTEDNKNFGFGGMSKKKAEGINAALNYIKSESPKTYAVLKEGVQSEQRTAAKTYHFYLVVGSLGFFLTGNFKLAAGMFGAYLLERTAVKYSEKKSGYSTGILGMIRDKLGLSKKANSPFEVISEDYDIGLWNRDDLN